MIPARLLLLLLAVSPALLFAQKKDKSEKEIKTVVNRFFEAMEKGDTALLRSTCTREPVMQTFMAEQDGSMKVFTEEFDSFVNFVGTPNKNKFREVIEFDAVLTEKSLASVWAPYKFYVNGKVSHCGTDSFQLVNTADGWKIQYIIDTRRKDCK